MSTYCENVMKLDYGFLKDIEPYRDDRIENFDNLDFDTEINQLQDEITRISTQVIPFEKTDFYVVFGAALCEIFADFMVGDPTNPDSLASKFNNSNNPLGKWMNNIHKKLDHSGNPLDFQGEFDADGNLIKIGSGHSGPTISFGGPNHRSLTYGHDLVKLIDAIFQYQKGNFIDAGWVTVDGESRLVKVVSSLNQYGNPYEPMNLLTAIASYCTHMFADFCSSKGLPIPGSSYLAHADSRTLRTLAADAYENGLNLRTLLLELVPVAITELIVRLYVYLKYPKSQYSDEAIKYKLDTLLLISHGIATAVNIGKVILTDNPFALNPWMILRTCHLVWKVAKKKSELTNRTLYKNQLRILKTELETVKTIILLDKAIYYTNNINLITQEAHRRFIDVNKKRKQMQDNDFSQVDELLKELRTLNGK